MTAQYSTMQKLTLAGMVIGSLLCFVGACAPFWIISNPQGPGEFGLVSKLVNKVVKGSLGLFVYCLEMVGQTDCKAIDTDNDSGWFHSARVGASVCVLVGGACGVTSMCLACCHCCQRFIALGIFSFLAAVSGAYCVGVFSQNTESFTGSVLGFQLTSYGWAYYTFIAGVAILGVVSFTACFSAPNSPLRGLVLSHQPPAGQVIVSNTSTMASHPYVHLQEQGGPVMMGPSVNSSSTMVTTNGY